MKIIFGEKGVNSNDFLYLDESDLILPMGKSFWEKPILFLNNLTMKSVDGKDFLKLFNFYDNSLWWLILPTVNPAINGAINFIDKFEKMIQKHHPSSLHLIAEFDKISIIKQICKKYDVEFSYSKSKLFDYKLRKKLRLQFENYRYKKITNLKISQRKELFSKSNKKFPSFKNKIILFSATSYRRTRYDPVSGAEKRAENILQPILDYFKEIKQEPIGIDVDYTFKGQKNILNERLNESIDWIPLELIYKLKLNESEKKFLEHYNLIISNSLFRDLFSFNGINFWEKIESEFLKLNYNPYLPNYLNCILSLDDFFTKQPPKLVFLPYEKGSYGVIMTMVCKKLGVKIIALEHGAFHIIEHIDYSYTNLQNDVNQFGLPLPDLTLVWGNAVKEFLIEKGYDDNQLKVFGNPEFFNFDKTIHYLQNHDFNEKFGVPKNKKIILFTTGKLQSFYKIEGIRAYDELVLRKLLESYGNNNEYYIIVKPHPANEPTHIYQKIIDSYHCSNFSIKQGNLFEMLQISNLLISIESTTLLDSILMGKPTFAITFDGKSSSDYYEKNNVLILSDLKSLPEKINESLNNRKYQEELIKNQKDFIKENYDYPNYNYKKILSDILNF